MWRGYETKDGPVCGWIEESCLRETVWPLKQTWTLSALHRRPLSLCLGNCNMGTGDKAMSLLLTGMLVKNQNRHIHDCQYCVDDVQCSQTCTYGSYLCVSVFCELWSRLPAEDGVMHCSTFCSQPTGVRCSVVYPGFGFKVPTASSTKHPTMPASSMPTAYVLESWSMGQGLWVYLCV